MGLFGGKPDSKSGESPSPAPPARPAPRASAPAAPSEAPTVIGRDTIVKGEVTGDTDMLIEGRVEGRIRGAKRVIIGESGDVEARVEAEIVTVRGKVNGDCEASSKIEITETGKVFGNISARAIVVAEGATFRGASKMGPAEGLGTSSGQEKPVAESKPAKQEEKQGKGNGPDAETRPDTVSSSPPAASSSPPPPESAPS